MEVLNDRDDEVGKRGGLGQKSIDGWYANLHRIEKLVKKYFCWKTKSPYFI